VDVVRGRHVFRALIFIAFLSGTLLANLHSSPLKEIAMPRNIVMFLFVLATSAGLPAAVVAAPVEAPTSASADGRDLAGLEHRWAIPQIFNSFDTNKDGYLSRQEAGVSSHIASQFDQLDKNGDGRLSVDELQAASPDAASSTARRGN
jgi:hypothetical protein